MVVQHNLTAMNANRYLGINNSKLSKSLEKLSSGYAINRAGDNAAGLAVSEKMRSQIAGMTQGVKNAQDGISMVQTFEGALTETHSILQRMKTLADQMGNDSYDDPVDRTAAQQEFLQLNDELNQIADTDFNGVVVLNGGVMSDGLKQVDGKFDYSLKAGQVKAANDKALADAQAAAQKKINSAQAKFDTAKIAYDDVEKRDLSNNGDAAQWNTVDNSNYDKAKSEKIFGEKGLDLTKDGVDSVSITFKATVADDGKITWEASGGKYIKDDGTEADVANFAHFKATAVETTNTTNGGFKVSYDNGETDADKVLKEANIANAVFDAKNVKDNDTVTLVFTNTSADTYAPDNIGFDMDSVTYTDANETLKNLNKPEIKLASTLTDASMTQATADALKKLDDATISWKYDGTNIREMSIDQEGLEIEESDTNGKYNIFYTVPGEGEAEDTKVILATITPAAGKEKLAQSTGAIPAGANAGGAFASTGAANVDAAPEADKTLYYDGTDWYIGTDATGTKIADGTKLKVGTYNFNGGTGDAEVDVGAMTKAVTGTKVKGDTITISAEKDGTTAGTLNWTATYNQTAAQDPTKGKVSVGVALDNFNFDSETSGPTVKPGKDGEIDSSVTTSVDKAYYDAKEALSAAKAAYPKTLADLGEEYKVSTSDAFNNSEAKMTYKDHMILQVGARTKDAVDFTFAYNSDAIGDLKADLNCTATGLGTDKLSIATQKDANYAVDKIDQAINKVSLIRGTFGAIQNRLEHKIDNMNVSIENLTSAESAIRDTNMPQEMMNFTKQQILAQASQSMLAQANQLPQGVLSLLQ